ncbi:unnamed protein product [Parajaminaea phylloscopi]
MPPPVPKPEDEDEDFYFDSGSESDDEVDSDQGDDENMATRTRSGGRPPASKAKAKKTFSTGLVLTTPRLMQSNVSTLFEDISSGDIDLEPDYQRGVVWPKNKQSAIIESLLSHYYIPPILLSEKKLKNGDTRWTCIDGKQRLSSIKLFMSNEIPVYDANGRTFFYSDSAPGRRTLPPEVAKRFRKEAIPTVVYDNLTDEQEREMFQRVQMGVTLSAAEKLSALRNKWTIFFDELTKKFMDSHSNSGSSLTHIVTVTRSQEWYLMAQSTLVILHSREDYVPTYSAIRTLMEKDVAGPSERLQAEVKETMHRFLRLANDPLYNGPLLPHKGATIGRKYSPVEFVQTAYMIWRYPSASEAELAEWCGILRREIHKAVPSQVRMNSFCTRFLRGLIKKFKPADAGTGSRSAMGPGRSAGSTSSTSTSAQKRPAEDQTGPEQNSRRRGPPTSDGQAPSSPDRNRNGTSSRHTLFNMSPSPGPSQPSEPASGALFGSLTFGEQKPVIPHAVRSTPRNPYA